MKVKIADLLIHFNAKLEEKKKMHKFLLDLRARMVQDNENPGDHYAQDVLRGRIEEIESTIGFLENMAADDISIGKLE